MYVVIAMGNHELTKENMKDVKCVCGAPADIEILSYNDRMSVDMRITCTDRHCIGHDKPYIMRNVHSAILRKYMIDNHLVTCHRCNRKSKGEAMLKLKDLTYICHSCLLELYGEEVSCARCKRPLYQKLMNRTQDREGEIHYICPTCFMKVYGSMSCLTCDNLDRQTGKCKRTKKKITWDLRKPMNDCVLRAAYVYGLVTVLAEDAGFASDLLDEED